MTDLLTTIQGYRRDQLTSPGLIEIRSDIMRSAEVALENLERRYRDSGSEAVMLDHEALATALDDLQEMRAEIVWQGAYDGALLYHMTETEAAAYDQLRPIAAKLKGESE